MKYALLFFSLLFFSPLAGQNYYVAIVKGEVYYNNKRVKKRSRINLKGTVRFTSKSDYLKLSGPGGLYTLRASSTFAESQGNEFLLAVKSEIYPRTVQRSTTSPGFSGVFSQLDTAYFGLDQFENTGFSWATRSFQMQDKAPANNVWAVMDTKSGLVVQPLEMEEQVAVLNLSDWQPSRRDHEGNTDINRVVFVTINDEAYWQDLRPQLKSSDELWQHFPRFELLRGETFGSIDSIMDVRLPKGVILDEFTPVVYNRKGIARTLKKFIKQSKAPDAFTFMHDLYYDEYIYDHYGYLNYGPHIKPILEGLFADR